MSSPKQNEVSADPTVAPEAPARIVWPTTSCFSAYDKHPVQMLQDRASELSGVSREQATEIDDINIGEKIGEFQMMQMIEGFSKRVLNDKDEWFRCMFSGTEDYVQNLNEYILQRLGGPSYYSDRKGTPGLIAKHAAYEMSPRTAERWLEYMDETLEEEEKIGTITLKQKEMIMQHFRWQAYLLVASQEAAQDMSANGPRPPNHDNPDPVSECPYPNFMKKHVDDAEQAIQDAADEVARKLEEASYDLGGEYGEMGDVEGQESRDEEDEEASTANASLN